MPTFSPPRFAASSGPAPLVADAPTAPVTGVGQSIYSATQELQRRKKALLVTSDPASPYVQANRTAGLQALEYQNPNNPLYAATTQNRQALIAAQSGQNAQQRAYYGLSGADITARQGENQALVAATHDTQDLGAVAQAQNQRNAVNRLRDSVGIARPLEIATSQGDTTPLPVGVTRALRTNADYIDTANREKDQARGFGLEKARNDLSITGTNVNDVRLAGDRAGLVLDTARAGAAYNKNLSGLELAKNVDQAQYDYGMGGLTLDEANSAAKYSGLVPDSNLYGRSGPDEYITRAEKDARDFAYGQTTGLQRIPQQYATTQARDAYSASQQGLGGLSPTQALAMLTAGTLGETGLTPEDVYKALLNQHYSPNAAFGLVTQAQEKTKNPASAPLAAFDESDFVRWLAREADSSEAQPRAQVQAELTRRFPNNPQAVQIKLKQLEDAAKKLKTGSTPTVNVNVP